MPSISGWYRPSSNLQRLYIRSIAHEFSCHFAPQIGTARCAGAECQLCGILERHRHAIVCVQVGQERALMLLEVRAHNAGTVEELLQLGEDAVGLPLFVWRDEAEHGSPIIMQLEKPAWAGRTYNAARLELKRVHCEKYISKIGTREYRRATAHVDELRPQLIAS